ncbi:hypothetical protein M758_4G071500 [Ceratodon purpureus]|uniref:Uncharacterized protein n=1 Tax=Ceratodon purpureus TaxID=3225 RepID=A0A8T0I5Y3_CERPU|nr:hypothetical protein KC19_4G070500 [Ceratodon purpureus]KAG0618529.1 hypothetical protein M758_4G071500 [Ceratodon purpureus]KAG0618530.1 hypothetical protein M758_4G071500 [Ceratodon purpureus]KAG0618531.1 hypothetical protein M758_4G071500 [Ceratodon purpureus]
MGKSQKLNQLLRKFLHKSQDDMQSSSGSSRFSLSGRSSQAGSQRSTFSSSRHLSTASSDCSAISSANYDWDCDCEEECFSSPPQDVPAGCFPVYVGEERRRFVIPTSYLANSTFQALLAKSEEEYGLRCEGGLRIACPPDAFEHLLWSLQGDPALESEEYERSSSGRSG